MRQKSGARKEPAEKVVRDIRLGNRPIQRQASNRNARCTVLLSVNSRSCNLVHVKVPDHGSHKIHARTATSSCTQPVLPLAFEFEMIGLKGGG